MFILKEKDVPVNYNTATAIYTKEGLKRALTQASKRFPWSREGWDKYEIVEVEVRPKRVISVDKFRGK